MNLVYSYNVAQVLITIFDNFSGCLWEENYFHENTNFSFLKNWYFYECWCIVEFSRDCLTNGCSKKLKADRRYIFLIDFFKFLFFFFLWDRFLLCCLGCPWTHDFPSSVSTVLGFTGVPYPYPTVFF
jgi:hypothetical protein